MVIRRKTVKINANFKKTLENPVCALCGRVEDDLEKYGERLIDMKSKLSVHYYCLILSSGLWQEGEEKDGFYGFLMNAVKKEVKRAAKLTCTVCKRKGASISCNYQNCRRNFHFPCGQENKCIFQFFDRYESFCWDHRPVQDVPPERRVFRCSICLERVQASPGYGVLKSPCCKHSWFHRICVQKHALSAGLYFCKCPLCSNKDMFQKEMLRMGIHIPQRDASWELEENAFHELLQVHQRCDVDKCLCDWGRDYFESKSKWFIVRCYTCGSMGTHLVCSALANSRCKWTCAECFSILHKGKTEEKALKRKKMTAMKSCISSAIGKVFGKEFKGSQTSKEMSRRYSRDMSKRYSTETSRFVRPGPSNVKERSSLKNNDHHRISNRRLNRRTQVRLMQKKRMCEYRRTGFEG
ncbi:PHD finger protein 7-like [Discoglossus pictus]